MIAAPNPTPAPSDFDKTCRFLTDETIVGTLIAVDDVILPISVLLMGRRNGYVGSPFRMYLVHGESGRVSAVDSKRAWGWVEWAEPIAARTLWDRPMTMFDIKPWSGAFIVPEAKVAPMPAPPKHPEPSPPSWWNGTGTEPVRCFECGHWRGRYGWCPVARKQSRSARMWRRCESFETPRETDPLASLERPTRARASTRGTESARAPGNAPAGGPGS